MGDRIQSEWVIGFNRNPQLGIAHETNPPQPELAEVAARHGYKVAYDGLSV